MRHRHGLRKLNMNSARRKAMFKSLANALILHEGINTTLPRAKELRRVIEPLVTLARKPSVANRRLAFARLRERESVVKLFDELGPRFAARPGGYVRVLKNGFRRGDSAPMAYIEFVDRDHSVSPQPSKEQAEPQETQQAEPAEEPVAEQEAQAAEDEAAEEGEEAEVSEESEEPKEGERP